MAAAIQRHYRDIDDRQLHYRSAGDPSRPTLVLFHQSPSHSAMYEPLMAELADDFYLLAPDSPGFGESDPLPDGGFDLASVAILMATWLNSVAPGPCFLFGHHTGASIAVELAATVPGLARAMALSGPPLLNDAQRESLPALAAMPAADGEGSHISALWRRLREKDATVPLSISERELRSALRAGPLWEASYRAVAAHDFEQRLASIDCPVLVYAGSEDPLYGSVDPTVAALSNGRRADLPGGERTYWVVGIRY